MRWVLSTAPLLGVFWLVLSGHFEALFLVLGALSVALVCWLARRADIVGRDGVTLPMALRLPAYFLWLGKEVFVSALSVTRRVWLPRPALQPMVEATPTREMSELAQVIYANSITLTPGTLSMDMDEDRILVHSLDPAGIETLHGGRMLRRVRRLEDRR